MGEQDSDNNPVHSVYACMHEESKFTVNTTLHEAQRCDSRLVAVKNVGCTSTNYY